MLANYVVIGWALGLGNSRVTLALLLPNTSANIVLDLLCVLGLGMTVDGVALGSVIADYLTLVAGQALIAALTDLTTVREAADQYLPWVAAMAPLLRDRPHIWALDQRSPPSL